MACNSFFCKISGWTLYIFGNTIVGLKYLYVVGCYVGQTCTLKSCLCFSGLQSLVHPLLCPQALSFWLLLQGLSQWKLLTRGSLKDPNLHLEQPPSLLLPGRLTWTGMRTATWTTLVVCFNWLRTVRKLILQWVQITLLYHENVLQGVLLLRSLKLMLTRKQIFYVASLPLEQVICCDLIHSWCHERVFLIFYSRHTPIGDILGSSKVNEMG